MKVSIWSKGTTSLTPEIGAKRWMGELRPDRVTTGGKTPAPIFWKLRGTKSLYRCFRREKVSLISSGIEACIVQPSLVFLVTKLESRFVTSKNKNLSTILFIAPSSIYNTNLLRQHTAKITRRLRRIYIQDVPGGMCNTSGECSLC